MKALSLRGLLVVFALLFMAGTCLADAAGKKAVILVAQSGFEDTEFKKPRAALEEAGVEVTVASQQAGIAVGQRGSRVEAALSFAKVNVADFDAVIFIGGKGSRSLVGNAQAQRVAREAMDANMIVGAICYAPVVLARANVAQDRIVTSANGWGARADLKRAGAKWKKSKVVVDLNLITASGPKASSKFGNALVEALSQ